MNKDYSSFPVKIKEDEAFSYYNEAYLINDPLLIKEIKLKNMQKEWE